MENTSFNDLLSSLSYNLTSEEIVLAGIKAEISAEITSKRIELGKSQSEFADYMGVSQGLVSRWESGDANFTLQSLVEIAQKLSIPIRSPFSPTKAPYFPATNGGIINFPGCAEWKTVTMEAGKFEEAELLEM